MEDRLLVIQVAALGYDFARQHGLTQIASMPLRPAQTVFPAVTCTVQGSFRTGLVPARHGMISNGLYHRGLHRPMFWEQSADLVEGERIWSGFRRRGGKVGMMFVQQSLGEDVDLLLSPAPIHKHHGSLIQDCYSRPDGLYAKLRSQVGKFNLMRYWGPLASPKVGDWIARATAAVVADPATRTDLLMVYLPSLDYDLQRFPAAHPRNAKALARTQLQLETMILAARAHGHKVLVLGDYAIADTAAGSAAIFPNRALAAVGLMSTRQVVGMLYPDFHSSKAFAMVDHQVAHVYVKDPSDIPATRQVLQEMPGVDGILDRQGQKAFGIDHANSGELLLIADDKHWFAYPWWSGKRQAPDYAAHIDIHSKPGYDPCELFFGWPPMTVSQDATRIRGSHGRIGPGREVAYAADFDLGRKIDTILDLSAAVRDMLEGQAPAAAGLGR